MPLFLSVNLSRIGGEIQRRMGGKYREIEERERKPMSDILIDLYERYGHEPKAQEVIAEKLGVAQPTLSTWIRYARLTRKTVLIRTGGDPQTN